MEVAYHPVFFIIIFNVLKCQQFKLLCEHRLLKASFISSPGSCQLGTVLKRQLFEMSSFIQRQWPIRSLFNLKSCLSICIFCQILRLKHSPAVTTKKNVAALRRESYTVDFIKKQIEEFNIGKRHLANMMGEDPETFTQEDVDVSAVLVLGITGTMADLCFSNIFQ